MAVCNPTMTFLSAKNINKCSWVLIAFVSATQIKHQNQLSLSDAKCIDSVGSFCLNVDEVKPDHPRSCLTLKNGWNQPTPWSSLKLIKVPAC